jgi:hypothetical protein
VPREHQRERTAEQAEQHQLSRDRVQHELAPCELRCELLARPHLDADELPDLVGQGLEADRQIVGAPLRRACGDVRAPLSRSRHEGAGVGPVLEPRHQHAGAVHVDVERRPAATDRDRDVARAGGLLEADEAHQPSRVARRRRSGQ